MSKSRSRLAADWMAKLRTNATTGVVEHTDVTTLDTEVSNTVNTEIATLQNTLNNTVNTAIADIETTVKDDRISTPSGTTDLTSPVDGDLYYNTTKQAIRAYNGTGWGNIAIAELGTEQNPANSAADILAEKPTSPDGIYYIKTKSGVAKPVYCMMSWGGWMLAAKCNSTFDSNYSYTGAAWQTTTPYGDSCTSEAVGRGVGEFYYDYNMTVGMRVSMNSIGNYVEDTGNGTLAGKTLKQAFTGSSLPSGTSRSQFINLLERGDQWGNQPNCNHAGFNISGSDYAFRWGLSMNNEANCSSNDSGIGIGGYTNGQVTGTRSANIGGWRWSTDVQYNHNGWIWVK